MLFLPPPHWKPWCEAHEKGNDENITGAVVVAQWLRQWSSEYHNRRAKLLDYQQPY